MINNYTNPVSISLNKWSKNLEIHLLGQLDKQMIVSQYFMQPISLKAIF